MGDVSILEKIKYRGDGDDDDDVDDDDMGDAGVCDVVGDWRGDWGLSCARSPVPQREIASSRSRVVESMAESVSETIW